MTKTIITTEEAIKKGYLSNKKISLKPSPRKSTVGITDPNHIAYFQIDQGSTFFCLPRNNRGDLVNVFSCEEEREFFENVLGLELNPSKPGNYFERLSIKVTKDSALMFKGESFIMLDPMDNLRLRVISKNPSVAPSEEDRKKRMEYRWFLSDESKLEAKQEEEYDSKMEFWALISKHSETPKLRSLLKIYFASIGSSKIITTEMSKQMLMKEINNISEDTKQRDKLLKLAEDSLFDMKEVVIRSLERKIVTKEGDDTYVFTGEERTYTFNEMAKVLLDSKNEDTELYFKIKAQLDSK